MLDPLVLLNSVTVAGVSRKLFCKDYKTIVITVATSGLGSGENFTLYFKGSAEETAPDFASAKSISNIWDHVQAIKQSDGSVVDGASGDLFSGSNDVRNYEVNVDGLNWVALDVGAITGSCTILAKAMCFESKNN